MKLEPNEHGNYPCPHCGRILTAILREWMNPPAVTDYLCLKEQIGFKVALKGSLEEWIK